MNFYVKCKEVSPGLISSERIVSIQTVDGVEQVPAHRSLIRNGELRVYPVNRRPGQVLVELPNESARGSWRVWVDEALLLQIEKRPANRSKKTPKNFDDYQELSRRTAGAHHNRELFVCEKAIGLAEEAGELAGLVKKEVFQGRRPTREKVIDEAGDVLWYLSNLCDGYGVTLLEVAKANVAKLRARYPDGFVKGGGIREGDAA